MLEVPVMGRVNEALRGTVVCKLLTPLICEAKETPDLYGPVAHLFSSMNE